MSRKLHLMIEPPNSTRILARRMRYVMPTVRPTRLRGFQWLLILGAAAWVPIALGIFWAFV